MSKKNKNQSKKKGQLPKAVIWIAVFTVAIASWGGWLFVKDYQVKSALQASEKTGIYRGVSGNHRVILKEAIFRYRETKSSLNPMQFRNMRQISSYGIAGKIPKVLDQMYCYCGCSVSIGHKSLLSCFTDNHAANCGVCMDEAVLANKMISRGETVASIADSIDSHFQ